MRNPIRTSGLMALLAVAALLALPSTAAAEDWQWGVTPYTWMPGVGLESKVNDTQVFNSRVSLNDLIDNTDFLAAIHLEGQRGTFGMLFDVSYFNLGSSRNLGRVDGVSGGDVFARTDLKETFVEVAGVWAPGGKFEGFGLIYGARIIDYQQRTDLSYPLNSGGTVSRTYRLSPTLLDAMVGFRYLARIGQRGSFNLRGDIAGIGTESTYNGLAGFGYAFDDAGKYTLLAGYRYMNMHLKEKDKNAEVETSMAMDGAYLAFRFGF